jgi:hypothetical protein
MSSYKNQTGDGAGEVVEKWDGTCRIEDGVLHISEKRYRRLKSSWFFILVMSVSLLLYGTYLHYTGAETILYDGRGDPTYAPGAAIIGIFGGILILMVIYGDYIWASLPFTTHTNETNIPLDRIHDISADNGAGSHTSNPHLTIEYKREEMGKKRVVNFAWEKNMRELENYLS